MNVNLRFRNTGLDELLRRYIDRRLRFALGQFRDRVEEVLVTVDGAAGRSGDSKCNMAIRLRPGGEITVQESGSDLFEAIDRAARRMGTRFSRELDRLQRTRDYRQTLRNAG